MSSIDPTSILLAQIRTQLAAVQRSPTAESVINSPVKQQSSLRSKPQHTPAELIFQRVSSIDPEDPDRRRKAFRVFLESILLNELGDELLSDPAFYRLVDRVQQTMESEEKLRNAINMAGDYLLKNTKA